MDDELRVVSEVRNGWTGEEGCDVKEEEVVRGEENEGNDKCSGSDRVGERLRKRHEYGRKWRKSYALPKDKVLMRGKKRMGKFSWEGRWM